MDSDEWRLGSKTHTYICVVTAGLSLQSRATGAGNINEPSLMSQDGKGAKPCVRRSVSFCNGGSGGVKCQVSGVVCLRSSCNHVTGVGGP
jgi:hypothetical protein